MITRPLIATLLAVVLAGIVATPASAQRFSLAPEIGFYVPTEHLIDAADGTVGELEAGPSFGLRLTIGLGSRISLTASGAYVPTTFAIQPGGGPMETRDARLFNGTGQLILYLIPPTAPLSLFLNGGVGVVSRGGVAFTDEAETTNVTGVFGAGAMLRLGGIALTAGADAFSYTAAYTGTTATTSELTQLDFQIRLGLGFPFGGGMATASRPGAR